MVNESQELYGTGILGLVDVIAVLCLLEISAMMVR